MVDRQAVDMVVPSLLLHEGEQNFESAVWDTSPKRPLRVPAPRRCLCPGPTVQQPWHWWTRAHHPRTQRLQVLPAHHHGRPGTPPAKLEVVVQTNLHHAVAAAEIPPSDRVGFPSAGAPAPPQKLMHQATETVHVDGHEHPSGGGCA